MHHVSTLYIKIKKALQTGWIN